MERHRTLRIGLTAIMAALLFRFFFSGTPQRLLEVIAQKAEKVINIMEETGQNVRFSPSITAFFPNFVESPPPTISQSTELYLPVFAREETAQLYYAAKVSPDAAALLTQPLEWDLTKEEISVLILHTHATESYTKKGEAYTESAAWRTLDENYNMLSIGTRVAARLQEAGIGVLHDRTFHDRPDYDSSYVAARETVKTRLKEHPSIQLVLDIHRDAAERSYGQLRTKAMIGDDRSAQIMLVLGVNHDRFEDNLSLGLKLHAQLERQIPGITRPLQLRDARYNQDLCPGSVIVEIGAAGNTHEEALRAADQLAMAVIALARGAQTTD